MFPSVEKSNVAQGNSFVQVDYSSPSYFHQKFRVDSSCTLCPIQANPVKAQD